MSSILRGTVKWFNDAKGFGFINHQSGKDVFVHYSVIQTEGFKTLKDGELVEYEITEGPKGLHAAKVQRLSETTQAPAAANKGSLKDAIEVERITDETNETYVTEMSEIKGSDALNTGAAADSTHKEYV